MSLDVYLNLLTGTVGPSEVAVGRIFIRRDGGTVEISREEWDRLYPGRAPVTLFENVESDRVFQANITHNLNTMADAAGLYQCMWRPDENNITHAHQLIEPLAAGLERLLAEPEKYRQFNPDNGWGSYDGLVKFVTNYLEACRKWPDAEVLASR